MASSIGHLDTATLLARMPEMTRQGIRAVLEAWHGKPDNPSFMVDVWIEEALKKDVPRDRLARIVRRLHETVHGPIDWSHTDSDEESDRGHDRPPRK